MYIDTQTHICVCVYVCIPMHPNAPVQTNTYNHTNTHQKHIYREVEKVPRERKLSARVCVRRQRRRPQRVSVLRRTAGVAAGVPGKPRRTWSERGMRSTLAEVSCLVSVARRWRWLEGHRVTCEGGEMVEIRCVTPHPQNTYTAMCPDFWSVFFILFSVI